MIVRNEFVWLPVTHKAKEVFASDLFEVYALHDDGSESLCETMDDVNRALEQGIDLCIAVGLLLPTIAYGRKKIAAVWSTDDVLAVAEQNGFEITEDDAEEVLELIDQNHDANVGINWDGISDHLTNFKK